MCVAVDTEGICMQTLYIQEEFGFFQAIISRQISVRSALSTSAFRVGRRISVEEGYPFNWVQVDCLAPSMGKFICPGDRKRFAPKRFWRHQPHPAQPEFFPFPAILLQVRNVGSRVIYRKVSAF